MSTNNITYILGAGASCYSQPLVSNMKERMNLLLKMLDTESYCNNLLNIEVRKETKLLYLKYRDIVNESFQHYTPDTFAKKLKLTDSNETLDIFKEFLNLYFIFEQNFNLNHLLIEKPNGKNARIDLQSDKIYEIANAINSFNLNASITNLLFKNIKPDDYELNKSKFFTNLLSHSDYRYDVFYATLLETIGESTLVLPSHINILSWNYDNQLELAYKEYVNVGLKNIETLLNIDPKMYDEQRTHIIKLNGSCNMTYRDDKDMIQELTFLEAIQILVEGKKFENKIYFAWEESNRVGKWGILSNIMQRSRKLVIIGYSFPNFNRQIDEKIFNNLNHELKSANDSILIQVPTTDEYKKIKERIQIITKLNESCFKHISDADQFYIPL